MKKKQLNSNDFQVFQDGWTWLGSFSPFLTIMLTGETGRRIQLRLNSITFLACLSC